jgi:hypothetical protein
MNFMVYPFWVLVRKNWFYTTTEVAHIIELPLSVLDDALVVDTNMSTSYADNIRFRLLKLKNILFGNSSNDNE